MNIIEKYDKQFLYAGVLINLIIAVRFFQLWYSPQEDQVSQIITMATLVGFEFIMVHSGVFMAVFPKKISLFIFFPIYGLFAWAFASMIDDWHIVVITYLVAVFNRMRFAFADVPQKIKSRNILTSVIAVMVYFFLMMIIAFNAEKIPHLGLSPSFLSQSNYFENIDTGGILLDIPQSALCFGVLYYCILAIIEFKLLNYEGNNVLEIKKS
ncbi:hypothetical protein ULMS_02960 [Patiriisocius marinistellae]|uniref:Uncharacterized protein n=1 Tax=Patiriisocius marinistellae TaxID=2494560 RepID=A0A5J4FUH2_9FLAO|nr:hypothetical protein [Patiriisocius marinistellae]GEQ84788.1 hypothetical protein ULMS_02960 [Patiriisocius marinistellae]